MKRFIFTIGALYLVLANVPCVSQSHALSLPDSIRKLVERPQHDTNDVNVLYNISWSLITENPDEAIRYAEAMLRISQELGWEIGVAKSHNAMGLAYRFKADYATALEHQLLVLRIAERTGHQWRIASSANNIAMTYSDLSDFPNSLEYFLKALAVNRAMGNRNWEAINLGGIGDAYNRNGQFQLSSDYLSRALQINRELNDSGQLAGNYTSIAWNDVCLSDFVTALSHLDTALHLCRALQLQNQTTENQGNIGVVYYYIACGRNDRLLKELFGGKKQTALQQARTYLDSAIKGATLVQNTKDLIDFSDFLRMVDFELRDYVRAYLELDYSRSLKDSVFNNSAANRIAHAQMEYAKEKQELVAEAERSKQQQREWAFIGGLVLVGGFSIFLYRQKTAISRAKARVETEKKRSDDLLLNILPAETAEELKATGTAKARRYESVTVMFTDFKNFTQTANTLSAEDLVDEINHCYSAFDSIITEHGLEKIKTIGDSYMCAAGLPVANDTHALDAAKAALSILDFMRRDAAQRAATGRSLFQIRIGLHTGPVVAGIVGTRKFAYDIWGDTVNIASRMESHGEAGRIHCSVEFVEECIASNDTSSQHDDYAYSRVHFVERGDIEIKGKGSMRTFFLERSQ